MCGISGIFSSTPNVVNKGVISNMVDKIEHRGPDAGGIWVGDNVAMGHRRLSIVDLSEGSNQPFWDESGRYCLVFNGEIYNYKSIRTRLRNYNFKTNGDTEVLLAAYIEWGANCLSYFNGMFSFAIYDTQEEVLFFARDRMAIKPLYYFWNDNTLIFSSEIRSILASNLVDRKIDTNGLCEYLSYQTVHSPNTIIKDIQQLEGGQFGILRKGKLLLDRYWSITDIGQSLEQGDDYQSVKKKTKELFFDAVEKRMISDVPLGAFLSGGIDSSAIVAAMSEVSSKRPSTFSIGFSEKEFDESKYAKIIADKFGTDHHNIKLSPIDFLEKLPGVFSSFDHPSGDGSNTYIVSELVKNQGITVALSGLGGDELFAGYSTFLRYKKAVKFAPLWRLPMSLKKLGIILMSPFIDESQKVKLSAVASENRFSFDSIYPYSRQILSQKKSNDLLKEKYKNISQDKLRTKLANMSLKDRGHFSEVSVGEILGYTQNVLLRDSDQMSMAHALELRVPFFDHNLVEYVLGLPDKYKYPTYPKKLLVESLSSLLPDEIVHRKKMGFSFPWERWLKGELRKFSEKNLNYLKGLEYFNGDEIDRIWNSFLAENSSIKWSHLWVLITLGAWLEKNDIQ